MKTCTKCGGEKDFVEFHKQHSGRDGLNAQCKVCIKTYDAWRYAANPIKRDGSAKYRAENPEKVKASTDNWRDKNREGERMRAIKYRADHPEANRINLQNRRARKLSAGGIISKDIAERLYGLQRGKCACGCKQPLGSDFHRDHIMPLALGGSNTDDNIQLLRSTCNQQKHKKHPADFMRQRGFLV